MIDLDTLCNFCFCNMFQKCPVLIIQPLVISKIGTYGNNTVPFEACGGHIVHFVAKCCR